MNRYFIKPLFWNHGTYEKPSGAKAKSGYPAENGFGHEEWNNNPANTIKMSGVAYRVFHITGLSPSKTIQEEDNVVVFFIASNAGTQYLVGIVSDAVSMSPAECTQVAQALGTADRWRDAWEQERVRLAYQSDEKNFRQHWRSTLHGGDLNWKCPEEQFLWLQPKRSLEPLAITGKKKLPAMFGTSMEIDVATAQRLLISAGLETAFLEHGGTPLMRDLRSKLLGGNDSAEEDIRKIKRDQHISETTRRTLIDARCGQGRFRSDLLRLWEDKCSVTSCAVGVALRASHIRPWKTSKNADRLDPENGLLLVATLDALFDRGWISFDDDGSILISSSLTQTARKQLGLSGLKIRKPLTRKQRAHLNHHRKERYDKHQKA